MAILLHSEYEGSFSVPFFRPVFIIFDWTTGLLLVPTILLLRNTKKTSWNSTTHTYKFFNQFFEQKAEMQMNPYPVLNPNPKPGFLEKFSNPYPYPSLIF